MTFKLASDLTDVELLQLYRTVNVDWTRRQIEQKLSFGGRIISFNRYELNFDLNIATWLFNDFTDETVSLAAAKVTMIDQLSPANDRHERDQLYQQQKLGAIPVTDANRFVIKRAVSLTKAEITNYLQSDVLHEPQLATLKSNYELFRQVASLPLIEQEKLGRQIINIYEVLNHAGRVNTNTLGLDLADPKLNLQLRYDTDTKLARLYAGLNLADPELTSDYLASQLAQHNDINVIKLYQHSPVLPITPGIYAIRALNDELVTASVITSLVPDHYLMCLAYDNHPQYDRQLPIKLTKSTDNVFYTVQIQAQSSTEFSNFDTYFDDYLHSLMGTEENTATTDSDTVELDWSKLWATTRKLRFYTADHQTIAELNVGQLPNKDEPMLRKTMNIYRAVYVDLINIDNDVLEHLGLDPATADDLPLSRVSPTTASANASTETTSPLDDQPNDELVF